MEGAAANCYASKPTKSGRIAEACISEGHQAIAEFADFTFHIEGASRALLAQLSRHRMASFAVRSQRYCDESGFKFVIPHTVSKDEAALTEFHNIMSDIQKSYNKLIELGIPKEDSRFVLPNACETIIEVKMNLRELIHFCGLRLCTRAQWEIRELAEAMKNLIYMQVDLPTYGEAKLSKYLVPNCEQHPVPFCTEQKCCGRHEKLTDLLEGKI